jgi:two-component system, OmpR family, response regulator
MELAIEPSIKIVVVDHDHRVRSFIGGCLRPAGASVILCGNAFEGMRAIESADLILVDMVMPDQDGFEFLHRRRDMSRLLADTSRPPIVVMGHPEMAADFRNAGLAYLPKPFTQAELIDAVVNTLHAPIVHTLMPTNDPPLSRLGLIRKILAIEAP